MPNAGRGAASIAAAIIFGYAFSKIAGASDGAAFAIAAALASFITWLWLR
jgi:hypothetical protein